MGNLGANHITIWTYDETATSPSYGEMISVEYPDGSWEYNKYDSEGELEAQYLPWKDVTLASAIAANGNNCKKVTTSDITDGTRSETFIEGVKVEQSERTTDATDSKISYEDEYFADGSLLRTTTVENVQGRTAYIDYPDGTRTSYAYENGVWDGNNFTTPDPIPDPLPAGSFEAFRKTTKNGTSSDPDGIANQSTWDRYISVEGETVLREKLIYTGSGQATVIKTSTSSEEEGDWDQASKTFTASAGGKALRERAFINNIQMSEQIYAKGQQVASTNRDGLTTHFTYDQYGRLETQTRPSVNGSITTTFAYDVLDRNKTTTTTGGTLQLETSQTYWPTGESKTRTDSQGLTSQHAYSTTSNGNRIDTTTRPDGQTVVTEYYLDGQLKSITGTGVIAEFYDYTVESNGNRSTIHYTGSSDNSSPRWNKVQVDWLGRTKLVTQPAYSGGNKTTQNVYDSSTGQLIKVEHTGLDDTLYAYDSLGRQTQRVIDLNDNNTIDLATDRVSETLQEYQLDTHWYNKRTSRTYLTDGSATPTTLSVSKTQRTGLAANELSKSIFIDALGQQTTTSSVLTTPGVITTTTDYPDTTRNQVSVTTNGQVTSSIDPSIPTEENATTLFTYDDLGRQATITDPRGLVTLYNYYTTSGSGALKGQIQSIITSSTPATPAGNDNKVRFEYYGQNELGAGQRKVSQNLKPDDDSLLNETRWTYDALNRVTHEWGSATYPKKYTFNAYGEQTTLDTYRNGTGWDSATLPAGFAGTGDTTTWNYQASTALQTSKIYADGNGTTYTYYDSGSLKSRTWQRGVATIYTYNGAGQLLSTDYSDTTTDITRTYDRAGRLDTLKDDAGLHTIDHTLVGQLDEDAITNVPGGKNILEGITINPGHDTFGRKNNFATGTGTLTQSMTYHAATGRLDTISQNTHQITYGYEPNTNLQKTTTSSNGFSTSKSYDSLNRTSAVSANSASSALNKNYTYDALNRRTKVVNQDNSYWAYTYNHRNEVQGGIQKDQNDIPIPGSDFSYTYDNLGNRLTFDDQTNGGPFNYTANEINQYANRENPDKKWIVGTINEDAYVLVNNNLAEEMPKGAGINYFSYPAQLDNANGPSYDELTLKAKLPGQNPGDDTLVLPEDIGHLLTPPANQSFSYDGDGNLTSDGLWTYTWNAENRLIQMESVASLPTAAKKKLAFVYDYQGRRIQKTLYSHDGTNYHTNPDYTRKFLYDGWNLVAELDGSNTLLKSYLWGTDLSGSAQGAGGVGGLLAITDHPNNKTYYSYSDANGNVTNLIDSTDGSIAATYDYSPFGQLLQASGPAAEVNPFRFSSKYQDNETNLSYYGYRYYSADLGRWLNRDPIQESGGINLYQFISNNGLNYYDFLGLIIDAGCPLGPYFASTSIKGKYTEKIGLHGYYYYHKGVAPSDIEGLILFRMMQSKTNFKIAGNKSIKEVYKNLGKHIEARKKIVQNTRNIKYGFGAGDNSDPHHTHDPPPDRYENPQGWHDSVNNPLSSIACHAATGTCFFGGMGKPWDMAKNAKTRNHLSVFIPGDWGYIDNQNYGSGWADGFRGENILHVGIRGTSDIFWGHIHSVNKGDNVNTIEEWNAVIKIWGNKAGTQSGSPKLRDSVSYPKTGLE